MNTLRTKMTAEDLIAEARGMATGPIGQNHLTHSDLSEFLRYALGLLLDDIDYEADISAGAAVAARLLAAIINSGDGTSAALTRSPKTSL